VSEDADERSERRLLRPVLIEGADEVDSAGDWYVDPGDVRYEAGDSASERGEY